MTDQVVSASSLSVGSTLRLTTVGTYPTEITGDLCVMTIGNPDPRKDDAHQCCQIASVRLRNLYVCRECAEWLHSIGVL